MKELIDKIQTLPNGVTSQLKYCKSSNNLVIVKVNKIEAFSNEYFAATPTKSARKTSLVHNNSTERSRSKSNSKRK